MSYKTLYKTQDAQDSRFGIFPIIFFLMGKSGKLVSYSVLCLSNVLWNETTVSI